MKLSKPAEIFLILVIWYGVRIVMITSGVTLIHIPLVDESIHWLFRIFADQSALRLWWQKLMYRMRY